MLCMKVVMSDTTGTKRLLDIIIFQILEHHA
jgi:hypothetical protein